MKISIRIFFVIVFFQLQLVAQSNKVQQANHHHKHIETNLIISSILNLNGSYKFSVYDPELKRRFWISSGKSYKGFTFYEYDKINSCVRLGRNNEILEVPIIKANERPIQILINGTKQDFTLENALPTTAEVQAYKELQYKNLPNPDAKNYQLLKNSADNRIESFSSTPIDNVALVNQATDDSFNEQPRNISLGGRTEKAKVKTTIHSSVFQESKNKAKD